jgi:uncharacterized protein
MSMATLTGPYDTAELPRMGSEPITVTVARHVLAGREAEFETVAGELQTELSAFPGCLGVGLLKPAPGGDDYQVVFRFTDPVSLRRWERSSERAAALARMDPLIADTRVQRVHGVEEFFDLPSRVEPETSKSRQVFGDIAWVSPVSLIVSLGVSPHLAFMPFVPRVISVVAVMTVTMSCAITPVRDAVRRRRRSIATT